VSVRIEIAEDPARECAAMLLGPALGGGHIVLAGGSTPRRAYAELVAAARVAGAELGDCTFWFGDERCVPPDDERSNFRMASEALFQPLGGIDALDVRRMQGELGFAEGADAYARELQAAGPPQFDVLLAGIGPDGHTLSLFPGKPEVGVRDRLVVGVPEAGLEPFVPRVSFTMAAVARARQVVLLAEGEGKAEALARAFGPGTSPREDVPSSLLAEAAKELIVLVDAAAAAGLDSKGGST
jgi:6-phosphogluconolactonase